MDFTKKRKLKNWWKDKKTAIIGALLFLGIGAAFLLIGFALTDWSIIDWLKSPYATTFFILAAIGIYLMIVVIIRMKQSHLGE